MKVSANPLVVAVALGLLGPVALADEDEPIDGTQGAADIEDSDGLPPAMAMFVDGEDGGGLGALEQIEAAWETVTTAPPAEPFDVK